MTKIAARKTHLADGSLKDWVALEAASPDLGEDERIQAELLSMEIACRATLQGTPDETSWMTRITSVDRFAWEVKERCNTLRRELSAYHREAQHAEGKLQAMLGLQMVRTAERLQCAERSYRRATALLRTAIGAAIDAQEKGRAHPEGESRHGHAPQKLLAG